MVTGSQGGNYELCVNKANNLDEWTKSEKRNLSKLVTTKQNLNSPISIKNIQFIISVKNTCAEKTPGLAGFPGAFYQTFMA